ncbi:Stk1 family PASTA domain-containing Ser/Thr kinase [Thermoactinomyces sp. CICC 10521]|nr:Stk1 family PASTA domain-containing Ser/Thr kinase [Thermoactinomyces sp. CICC 10523]MBH8603154.1 Stk1 family PASTA domain-containing Ser/Thr kinase [Thermoactinomyces sp. CICC 10522]MBH8607039.1 Stk1 family PASTA domain-containing Ser/Thr kinase [Thermoactinomyces sp. CICC 10521]
MTMQMEGKKLGGRYEIVSRVGGGGMAVVYKAKDLLLNRYVAIKVLSDSLSNDSEFIRRFSREAQAAASLSHPNIVNVYDVGKDHYTHYIVMELVEGPTLKQYIQERGPLPAQEAAAIAIQICDGLAHAHENQIVHRDIKPHNILLGANGRAKVTDFGIARAASSSTITQEGSVMGSVHYFSPEQARGGVIGEKSDLYSLGIVLYEMLTGRLPFDGDSAISIALKHLQEIPEDPRSINPNIPDALAEVILCALDKDPNKRFSSAREMLKAIQQAANIGPRLEANWAGTRSKPTQRDLYQTIPLSEDEEGESPVATAVEPPSYHSPIQRPEIRSGQRKGQVASNALGDKTLANLERLKSAPNDSERTMFQRTVVWLENVQANLPWWQKLLFGLITIIIILVLTIWGFDTIWGLFSGGSEDQTVTENTGKPVKMELFTNLDEAKKWLADNGFPEPKIIPKPKEGVQPGQIWDQEPRNGTMVDDPANTQVKIYVGVEGAIVDNYYGKFESAVHSSKLADKPYKVELYRCPDPAGQSVGHAHIFRQEPEAGTFIKKGGVVKVYSYIANEPKCELVPGW